MKKLFLFTLILGFYNSVNGQSISVVKDTEIYKYGNTSIRDDRTDKSVSWDYFMWFRDDRYDYIIESGSITFTSEELKKFTSLLKEMVDSEESNLEVRHYKYDLVKYDFNPNYIYITDDEDASTKLPKSQIHKLYNIVNTI